MNHHRTTPSLRPTGLALGALVAALAAACSTPSASGPEPDTDSAQQALSDERIVVDHAAYARQQAAIKTLNDSGRLPLSTYSLAKAQCWLDVSFHEYTRNDRSPFLRAALDQSRQIVRFLAAGGSADDATNPARHTPLVNGAQRLRPDLWSAAAQLKQHPGFVCAQARTACAEVELAHAGHEINQQGWRHAKPYVQMAEDALEEAGRQAAACPASAEPPQPAVAPLPALPSAPAVVVVAETITLRAGALFRFDGGAASDLLVEGRAQLDELASGLAKTYLTIESITLVGHADRLGNADYNLRLSRQRAETVKEYLGARGVAAPMVARGVGASRPLVACNADRSTGALKSCLQANRRVEIVVRGVRR